MKRFWLAIAAFWLISSFTAMSQEANAPTQAKGLLEKIVSKTSQRPGWDEPAMAIENSNSLKRIPEFIELQQVVSTTWPQIASNIESVAPSEMAKTILFVAMQSLPADNYLEFLDRAVGLAETESIDKRLLEWAIFPADKNLRGVLDYNYDEPVVKDILQRTRVLYANDISMVRYCDAVLSGEAKKSSEAYYRDNPNEPRPNPALSESAATTPKTAATKTIISQDAKATPTEQSQRVTERKSSAWPLATGIIVLALIVSGVLIWKGR